MRTQQKVINLYNDSKISSIKLVFSVSCEDDLNQCWDYFGDTFTKDINYDVQGFITILYSVGLELFEKEHRTFFEVILEQNDEYYYFTIWNKYVAKHFAKLLEAKALCDFKMDVNKISIKIAKTKPEDRVIQDEIVEEVKEIKSINEKVSIEPYTFLSHEDLEEILETSDDMIDVVIDTDSEGLNKDAYIRLRSLFSTFSLVMSYYDELVEISSIFKEFNGLISGYEAEFLALNKLELATVEGFVNNIDRWCRIVFVDGGADLHFMDDSFRADVETIKMLILPQEVSDEEDLDDIFDF